MPVTMIPPIRNGADNDIVGTCTVDNGDDFHGCYCSFVDSNIVRKLMVLSSNLIKMIRI